MKGNQLSDIPYEQRYEKMIEEQETANKKIKVEFEDLASAPEPKESWLSKSKKYHTIPQLQQFIKPVEEQVKNVVTAKMRETAICELLATGILTKPEYHVLLAHLHKFKAKTERERAKLETLYLKHTPRVELPHTLFNGMPKTGRTRIRYLRSNLHRFENDPKGDFYFRGLPSLDLTIRHILSMEPADKVKVIDNVPTLSLRDKRHGVRKQKKGQAK